MSCVWHCHLPDHVQPCAQHWWFLRRGRGRGLQCRARSMDRGRLSAVAQWLRLRLGYTWPGHWWFLPLPACVRSSVARIRYAAPARRLPCRPAGSTVVCIPPAATCCLPAAAIAIWLRRRLRHLTMGVLCCLPDARTGSSVYIIRLLFDEFSLIQLGWTWSEMREYATVRSTLLLVLSS